MTSNVFDTNDNQILQSRPRQKKDNENENEDPEEWHRYTKNRLQVRRKDLLHSEITKNV